MYEQQRKKGRPLTGTERSLIEHLYKLGFTQTAIAKEVGVWPSTICRELRRGMVDQLNGDTWEYYRIYSPQKAQNRTGIFHHKSNNYLLTLLRKSSNFVTNS